MKKKKIKLMFNNRIKIKFQYSSNNNQLLKNDNKTNIDFKILNYI